MGWTFIGLNNIKTLKMQSLSRGLRMIKVVLSLLWTPSPSINGVHFWQFQSLELGPRLHISLIPLCTCNEDSPSLGIASVPFADSF